jgi:hypothetical protein
VATQRSIFADRLTRGQSARQIVRSPIRETEMTLPTTNKSVFHKVIENNGCHEMAPEQLFLLNPRPILEGELRKKSAGCVLSGSVDENICLCLSR